MELTYESRCQKCGGLVNSQVSEKELTEAFEKMARRLYEGEIDPEQLDPDFYRRLTDHFKKALREGYPINLDKVGYNSADLLAHQKLMQNLYAFSGAKTFAQLSELRALIRDDKGQLRSYSDFKEDALKVNSRHNLNWLNTEYNNAVNSSISAANWQRHVEDSDLFPYLVYQTIGDSNVREEHQRLEGLKRPVNDPIWDKIYPPNDWGCRCEAINDSSEEALTEPDEAEERSAGAIRNKLFRNNPGKTGLVFKDSHPYFKAGNEPAGDLKAVQNYGLTPVQQIYNRGRKLAKPGTAFQNTDSFETWWDKQVQKSSVKNGFDISNQELKNKFVAGETFKASLIKGDFAQAKELIRIIQSPDEVYAVRTGTTVQTKLIKYYEKQPYVVLTESSGRTKTNRIISFKLETIKGTEKNRKGTLTFKS